VLELGHKNCFDLIKVICREWG